MQVSISLTHQVYKVNQLQQYEADAAQDIGISLYQLMERAGEAVFKHIEQLSTPVNHLLIIAGKGNNGGDGYIIARHAYQAGMDVNVIVYGTRESIKGDAKLALQALEKVGVSIYFCKSVAQASPIINQFSGDLIVDCLFGIGFRGILSLELTQLIKLINSKTCKRLSVDVPSGLDANVGVVAPIAVNADITVTLIAYKSGLLTGQAANYVGKLVLVSLGVNQAFATHTNTHVYFQSAYQLPMPPMRQRSSHKGTIGLLLAIGGSAQYAGAMSLCAEAALRCGAALVAACCHSNARELMLSRRPELMAAADSATSLEKSPMLAKAKAIVIGPGLGREQWAKALFSLALAQPVNKVLDADALRMLAQSPQQSEHWILTPHPGEAAALLGCDIAEIEADRYSAVLKIAQCYGGVCVLKGAGTLVSDGHSIWVNSSGNPGMASGGMGDVLAGIIAALVLQMPNLMDAARLGVYIHGRSADIIAKRNGQIGILASDLFTDIQRLVNNPSL